MADKKKLEVLDTSKTISEAGLDALYVLEGHTDAQEVVNMNTGKKEWTGLYGVTDSCIKQVKQFAKGKYELPEEMSKIKNAKELGAGNDAVARDYARYYIEHLKRELNRKTDNSFDSYTPHQQDVLLTYVYNVGTSKLSTGTKGSLLDAIKEHNEDEVIRRIFMKADGSLADYDTMTKQDKRGLANRWLATMQWWYNPNFKAINSIKDKDDVYTNTYNATEYKNLLALNKNMSEITKERKNNELLQNSTAFHDFNGMDSIYKTQKNEQKQPENKSFLQRLGEIGMAIANPMYDMVRKAQANQVANEEANMLNNENGAQK